MISHGQKLTTGRYKMQLCTEERLNVLQRLEVVMLIWRPFDLHEAEEDQQPRTAGERNERLKIRVTENEKNLVMDAYNANIDQGWDAVLRHVKENVEELPLNSRVVGCTLTAKRLKQREH